MERSRTFRGRAPMGPVLGSALRGEAGLTLIEVIVVITIAGLLVAVASMSLSNLTRAHLRAAAGRLAGAIRYTYDKAIITGTYYRMTFNLDENTYKIESSEDLFFLTMEKSEDGKADRSEEEKAEEEEKENLGGWDEKAPPHLKHAKFTEVKMEMMKPVKLEEDGVSIQSVFTKHQQEPYEEGEAYLYFFPRGRTEFALIYLADKEDTIYTLRVSPLSGKVKIFKKKIELDDDVINVRVEEEFKTR